jgi:hypothetical protein
LRRRLDQSDGSTGKNRRTIEQLRSDPEFLEMPRTVIAFVEFR